MGKGIIQFRQFFFPDFLNGNLESSCLTGKFRPGMVFGENYGKLFRFAHYHIYQMLTETGGRINSFFPDGILHILTVQIRFAVQGTFNLHKQHITHFNRALRFFPGGSLVEHLVYNGINIFFGNFHLFFSGSDGFIITQFHYRRQGYAGGKYKRFGGDHGYLRGGKGFYFLIIIYSLLAGFGDDIVHYLIQHFFTAEVFFKHVSGGFTLAETRDFHLFYQTAVSFRKTRLNFSRIHLYRYAGLAALYLFICYFHGTSI
ncbi:MAG: hypothetical protein EGMGGAKC_00568 [Dehalococcoides mccartyi]|nr:hypothetical protein [Dehalococcoides mccartyi]